MCTADRRQRLLQNTAADACIINSPENVLYVTGFTGGEADVVLFRDKAYLFTDSRYTEQAVQELNGDDIEVRETAEERHLLEIRGVLDAEAAATVGMEADWVTVRAMRRVQDALAPREFVDISDTLVELRSVKSHSELAAIQTAARATDAVMEHILHVIREGMTEKELHAEILSRILRSGYESSFDPIVAAGINGAMPHARPSDYAFRRGDLITMDFGCRHRGYCADMTRTVGLGHIDGEIKTIYHVVEEAQQRALDAVRVGVHARQIDGVARSWIEQHGYGENFGHGTGHGVGLQIHELPVVNRRSDAVIEAGMAFTVEPGIYLPGLGGVRIEDTCTPEHGSLFKFPKRLIEL